MQERVVRHRLRKSWSELEVLIAGLNGRFAPFIAFCIVAAHTLCWTIVLTVARAGEDLNSDSTETYAWGLKWLWGYGKHPPLSGWIAHLWFEFFPTANWAMYALSMATTGAAAWICWGFVYKVASRRRAFLGLFLLLVYPVFTFRGSRFDPDLLELPLFALVVLLFLAVFDRPGFWRGFFLGLACAAAMLCKYWALLIIGSIGLAALVHPDRARVFRSSAPYVAVATFLAAMLPHVIWLSRSDYAPFRYASRHFLASDHSPLEQIGLAFGHHLALLILPFLLFVWVIRRSRVDPDTEIRWARAQSIWIIAACLVIVPPVMALGLHVYLAVDWGNSLYFFVPLAAVLYPRLALSNKAVVRAGRVWGATVLCALLAAPLFQWAQKRVDPGRYAWQLADVSQAVSTLWHDHYTCPMPVIAGPKFAAAAVSFYSPDHPILFTNFDTTVATWIDLGDLRRSGFAAICPAGLIQCEEVARAIDPAAEHVPIRISSALHKDWIVYLMRKTDAGRASC